MHAVVVYESHWGNTEAVAKAIAEGIGSDAEALPTDLATPGLIGEADLVVAGAPVLAFSLPRESMQDAVRTDTKAPRPGDVSHPSLRSWLEALPAPTLRPRAPRAAAFETRLRWSLGGATGSIDRAFTEAGFEVIGKPQKFVVTGSYGPLRDGELDRAREWGIALGESVRAELG
jgi:hypothetical protein